MSDILEDQRIHFIVKDYQRMFDMHHELVDACKEASKVIDKKDKKIAQLEMQLEKERKKPSLSIDKNYLSNLENQFKSLELHARRGQETIKEMREGKANIADISIFKLIWEKIKL